jgi:hypothetical protein
MPYKLQQQSLRSHVCIVFFVAKNIALIELMLVNVLEERGQLWYSRVVAVRKEQDKSRLQSAMFTWLV